MATAEDVIAGRASWSIEVSEALTWLQGLPSGCVQTCVTSPPYWGLRDYGVEGQLGLEPTPDEYLVALGRIFAEVNRVLRDDGTLWLNLGDSYAGSWGAQGRQGATGQMADRSVASAREKSKIRAASIAAHPQRETNTGSLNRTPGLKAKDLVGIPWMVAFALRDAGWYLRQDIIWHKPSPMPESVKDRCTKAHEYLFLMSKSKRYYYDQQAIAEPCEESNASRPRMGQGPETKYKQKRQTMKAPDGWATHSGAHGTIHREGREKGSQSDKPAPETRNKRSVWSVATCPYPEAHFATFPRNLIVPCILAGAPPEGLVMDPFGGSGTVAEVALMHGRRAVLCELNPEYVTLAEKRMERVTGVLFKEDPRG